MAFLQFSAWPPSAMLGTLHEGYWHSWRQRPAARRLRESLITGCLRSEEDSEFPMAQPSHWEARPNVLDGPAALGITRLPWPGNPHGTRPGPQPVVACVLFHRPKLQAGRFLEVVLGFLEAILNVGQLFVMSIWPCHARKSLSLALIWVGQWNTGVNGAKQTCVIGNSWEFPGQKTRQHQRKTLSQLG
jgi:hypothetical protein